MAKKWPGSWFNAKERDLKKLLDRGEGKEALGLLVDVYYQPGTSPQMKQRCVHELVNLKALAEPSLDVYIDYLRHAARDEVVAEVLALLAGVCDVDFDADQERLLFAQRIAAYLHRHNLRDVPGTACVQGMYSLLVQSSFAQAVTFFEEALKVNATNHIAQSGLLIALIRLQRYEAASGRAQQFAQPLHQQVEGLALFLKAWCWLETSDRPGPLPGSVQQLESLNLGRHIGSQAALVIGRLHLLEGDAQQALSVLRSAASYLTEQPRWYYYIAWAYALMGDRQGILDALQSTSTWSGRWTIACLLLDIDPTLAQQHGVLSGSTDSLSVPETYAAIFRFRIAGWGGHDKAVPAEVLDNSVGTALSCPSGAGSFEEDLEALRSRLGAAFMVRDTQRMHQLIDLHLFERLPLADQLFWRGLYTLLMGDQEQGDSLLNRAARGYGHHQAAFVFALHHLKHERTEPVDQMLNMACSGRTDTRVKLLLAYSHLCQGDLKLAEEELQALVDKGHAGISYALGNLWLLRAQGMENQSAGSCYAEATRHFEAALDMQGQSAPVDWAHRAGYARLMALAPETRRQNEPVARAVEGQQLQTWNEIMSRLFSATPALVAVASEDLLDLLLTGPRPKDSTCVALALLVARACKRAEKVEQAEKMLALLKYLAADKDLRAVQPVYRQCVTLVARRRYQQADEGQRVQIFQQIRAAASEDPANFALRLLAASLSLKYEDQPSATALLAGAKVDDMLELHLQVSLCDVLAKTPQQPESTIQPQQIPEPIRRGYDMLQAVHAFATQRPVQGYEYFMAVVEDEIDSALSVTDLRRIILSLCTYSQQQKEESLSLLEKALVVAARLGDSEFSLSLARALVGSGELTSISQHLAEVLTPSTDPEGRLRREWRQLHCYQAVAAYKTQDYLKAAQHLRLAATFEGDAMEAEKLKRFADRLEDDAGVRRLLVLQQKEVRS